MSTRAIFCLIVFVTLSLQCLAEDWPQWRGLGGRGEWKDEGIRQAFSDERAAPVWRAAVGAGYSGPTVRDGRVYVTDRVVKPGGSEIERVLCFDARLGKKLWGFEYDCPYEVSYPLGPRAAVTVSGGRAFALGTMGHLHVLDAETGDLIWKKQLVWEYNVKLPMWGMASAPVVHGDLVILHIGGRPASSLVAFEVASGTERWRTRSDKPSYSTPILVRKQGKTTLIAWTGENLLGLDPGTGQTFWEIPIPPIRSVDVCLSPVVSPDGSRVFVSAFYEGCLMVELGADGRTATILWERKGKSERKTDGLHSMISSPVWGRIGKYLYGIDSYGELRCLRASDGERMWVSRDEVVPYGRWATAHMVRNGGEIWIFNEQGELLITRLSSATVKVLSKTKLIEPTTELPQRSYPVAWSHPAFADQRVFARNDKELICVRLGETAED